mmetsp:Transcript_35183/g.40645  ORF Transcript_35183/g.40645 Transcript_35183/m.40645 type:complete len:88 (-) Transcript_35183:37-300(-)
MHGSSPSLPTFRVVYQQRKSMASASFRYFSSDQQQKEQTAGDLEGDPKPLEYQAPVDDTKDTERTRKFIQKVFIMIPLTMILIYKLC